MYAIVARQPIIDRNGKIAAYELFYRNAANPNAASIQDGDLATLTVLSNAVNVFGFRELTDGLPAYVNFTRNMLLGGLADLVSPNMVAIEVMEDVEVDDELDDKLHALKKAGFRLVLQKYSGQKKFKKLTSLFDVIRIDFSKLNSIRRREMAFNLAGPGTELLGEHVERLEDYSGARQMGYSLFQGYYFGHPELCRKELPPLCDRVYGQLITELMKSSPNMRLVSGVLENDVMLSYMIQKRARDEAKKRPGMKAPGDLRSILQSMRASDLWRMVLVLMTRQMNVTGSDKLPREALTRACFMETLVSRTSGIDPKKGFLLGLFSKLGDLAGEDIMHMLAGMRLDADLISALNPISRDSANVYCQYLDFVDIFEMASMNLRLPPMPGELSEHEIENMYNKAVDEAEDILAHSGE